MGKPSAPRPPDPRQTSAAATGSNIGTSIANTMMGNVNQVGPNGSLTYSQNGAYDWTDPFTGQTYQVPRFTATTQLSPEQQRLYDQNTRTQTGLSGLAGQQVDRLGGLLSTELTAEGLPARGTAPNAQPIQRSYGPGNFSQDRARVEQTMMTRLAPQLAEDRRQTETDLANQGITRGSAAWRSAQGDLQRGANDARFGAIMAGGEEQSRLMGLARDQAGFRNAASGQAFNQDMSRAGYMDGQRAQAMQEAFALRSQPINEIAALLSGSQVNMPNFQPNRPTPIPFTDNAGLISQNYQQRQNNYANQMNLWQQGIGGLFGLGASALTGLRA